MKRRLIVLFLFSALASAQTVTNVGIHASLTKTSMEYFSVGYKFALSTEISLTEKFSLVSQIGLNELVHSSSEALAGEDQTGLIEEEEATTHWYILSLQAKYCLFENNKVCIKIGGGPELNYFPSYKGLFDDKIVVKGEMRFGIDGITNLEYKNVFGTPFGFNLALEAGYIPETDLEVDRDIYIKVRPFKKYFLYQIQFGLTYGFH